MARLKHFATAPLWHDPYDQWRAKPLGQFVHDAEEKMHRNSFV